MIFKAVGDSRPYPDHGLVTPKDWSPITPRVVRLADLTTTRATLDLSALPAGGTYRALLLDATGRQVRQLSFDTNSVAVLDVRELPAGIYQVLVSGTQADGAGFRQLLRLSKQ